jgi:hypothetical protein
MRVFDAKRRPLLLFADEFSLRHTMREAEGVTFHEVAV